MQQHGSNFFARRVPLPHPRPWGWVQSMVNFAFQIKENHKYSNMVANTLAADPSPYPPSLVLGQYVKIQLFQNRVMLHNKLKRVTNAATLKQKFCSQNQLTPTLLGMGSMGKNSTFLEHGHVAYQIKGNP